MNVYKSDTIDEQILIKCINHQANCGCNFPRTASPCVTQLHIILPTVHVLKPSDRVKIYIIKWMLWKIHWTKLNRMQKKSEHEKKLSATNSMASVFRRRVLKWYFIQTLFFSPGLTQFVSGRRERKKKPHRAKKVFMHSIYILINSHVGTHRRKHRYKKKILSSTKTHVWKVRNAAKQETAFPGVSIFCTLSSVALWCMSWQTTLFCALF